MTNMIQLSSSDIAQMAGVGLSTVSNWRRRHEDFPEPVSGSAASPRFDATEVQAWLKTHGKKIQHLSADNVLWNIMDRWRGSAPVEDMARFISALLVWRFVSDLVSPGFMAGLSEASQWPALTQETKTGQALDALQKGVREYEEKSEDQYRSVFEDLHSLPLQLPDSQVERALEQFIHTIDSFDPEDLGSIYLAFHDRVTQSLGRSSAVHPTSQALIDVFVAVSRDIPGPVHDPAVGSGRLLFAVGNQGQQRTRITGQEIHLAAYHRALQRALITGQENLTLKLGDVFQTDYFEPGSAQVVVIDPPYAMRYQDIDRLALDHRLPYGTPPNSRLDTGWLQIALWYLGSGGRAFVLQIPGTAYRSGSEATIRANMLKSGTVEAVVSLPPGMASGTSIPLDLWVLTRPGESTDSDKVLLIDYSDHKQLNVDRLAKMLRDWRTEGAEPEDARAGVFMISDILEKDSVLTPKRWIAYEDDTVSLESIRTDMEALDTAVQALDAVKHVNAVELITAHHTPRLISIAELVKTGSVKVLRSQMRGRLNDLDEAANGTPVIDRQWIRGENSDPQKIDLKALPGEPLITQPGDVLLQNTGGLAARVDQDGGRVLLSPNFQVLRLQDDTLIPEYLAEMLVSAANRRQAMGTGIQRIGLEDLHVALLSHTDQQRLADQFQRIRQLQATVQAVLRASSDARDALVDGITGGVVQAK